ncbi:MAG TPA: DUF1080 domain-containing protein [Candidatus Udaeobacter sp.]|jgi:hypothetical protein|nr:DUF1080 domain-containing protein [Candidatus Udaeobacter sp.]
MKRLSVISMGLLVMGFTFFGCSQLPFGQSDAGWVTLLDGPKGLENWNQVAEANWRVVDGVVQADKKVGKENAFLVSKNSYKDFMVRVEFWASDDANSGIFMRCQDPKKITDKSCYEANIYDQRPDPSYGTGGIVHFAKVSPMPKAGGKWNTYEITAKGPQLVVMLNGAKTVELTDSSFTSGPIALQYGTGVVKFRKVQIKPL